MDFTTPITLALGAYALARFFPQRATQPSIDKSESKLDANTLRNLVLHNINIINDISDNACDCGSDPRIIIQSTGIREYKALVMHTCDLGVIAEGASGRDVREALESLFEATAERLERMMWRFGELMKLE